ncbi:MAG TPA: hypothetical protein VHQ90_03840 [Thermoanaerobaculia bacterium]|nr:hypothetical protein [Thermoanaerobaculia bacterium]
MTTLIADAVHAGRGFLRSPGFTLAALLTLGPGHRCQQRDLLGVPRRADAASPQVWPGFGPPKFGPTLNPKTGKP